MVRKQTIISCLSVIIMISSVAFSQSIDWHAVANPAGFQTNSVRYSADGSKVIVGTDCHPAKIRIFNASNGVMQWDYTVGSSLLCIMGVGIGSNGKYIAAIEEFGNLLIFDNTTSPPDSIKTIVIGTTYAFSQDFSPTSNKIAVGGSNGKLAICSIDSGTVLHTVSAHFNWITATTYSPNGQFIATGGNDALVKLWDTTGLSLGTLNGHTNTITDVRVSNNGGKLFSSSLDWSIKIWNSVSKSLIKSIKVSRFPVNSIALSPNNDYFVTVSSDSIIRIFNSTTGLIIDSIFEPTHGYGLSVDWSKSANQIAVGTKTGKVVTYSVQGIVAVPDLDKEISLELFPNPISSGSILFFETQSKINQIKMTGITGQNIPISSIDNSFLVPSNLEKGIYFLTFISEDKSVTKKIIVN